MRPIYAYALFLTLFIGAGSLLSTALAVCPVPLGYRLGALDQRFGLSEADALEAVAAAEAVWESATGRELFAYDPAADFTVNFRYDERQAFTEAELASRAELSTAEAVNESIAAEYNRLVAEYDELEQVFTRDSDAYEAALAAYNAEVERYNARGGAPAGVYEELERTARELERERQALEERQAVLDTLVAQINEVSERGNQVVDRFNEEVAGYNETFGGSREFTQGTYSSDGYIDIYSFDTRAELELVLAHELGHALGIDHVSGAESLMYFLIGEQPATLSLSSADQAAFELVCGEGNRWATIGQKIRHLFL